MGNLENKAIDQNQLAQYLKEGITMQDLINLKKAFISLDTDSDGYIEYDVNKITELNKYDLPVSEGNKKLKINENQFMNIMIDNIIDNRKKFGKETINYEKGMEILYYELAQSQSQSPFQFSK